MGEDADIAGQVWPARLDLRRREALQRAVVGLDQARVDDRLRQAHRLGDDRGCLPRAAQRAHLDDPVAGVGCLQVSQPRGHGAGLRQASLAQRRLKASLIAVLAVADRLAMPEQVDHADVVSSVAVRRRHRRGRSKEVA